MDDFSLLRDYKNIVWKDTFQVNLIRSACAGPVWSVVALLAERDLKLAALYLFLMPVMYLLVMVPMGTVAIVLNNMKVPFAGLFVTFLSLMVAVGDPLAFLIRRSRPGLLPLKDFKPFNFVLILFVVRGDDEPVPEPEDEIDVAASRRAWVSDLQRPQSTSPAVPPSTNAVLSTGANVMSGALSAAGTASRSFVRAKLVIGGGLAFVVLVVGGGGYWYSKQRSGSQVVASPPPVGTAPANRASIQKETAPVETKRSATTEQAPVAAHQASGETQLAQAVAQPQHSTEVRRETPKPKEKVVAKIRPPQGSHEPQTVVAPQGAGAREVAALSGAAGNANRTTCQGIGGLYRLTCEIEGPANYFKCAPEGKNWNHDIPGCDRRH